MNSLHGLIYLNTLSQIGETVWEGLEAINFLEEVGHWRWDLGFQKHTVFPNQSPPPPFLCLMLVDHMFDLSYCSRVSLSCLASCHDGSGLTLWKYTLPLSIFNSVALVMVHCYSNRKIAMTVVTDINLLDPCGSLNGFFFKLPWPWCLLTV